MLRNILLLLGLVLVCASGLSGQGVRRASLSGMVTDGVSDKPIGFATVYVQDSFLVTETAENGRFKLDVPAEKSFLLVVTRIGYKEVRIPVEAMPVGSSKQIDIGLVPADASIEVVVRESKLESGGMVRETMEQLKLIPSTSGNFESLLPSIALGTSGGTGGELSSQYNVRGGNYDENLVYVNDFEIYRPQLVRAGQQEGLSFPNVDLIRDVSFSSGGFEARYGDKLSSVLDIKYKRPDTLRASLSGSMLGAAAHLEGSWAPGGDASRKLRYLMGARYKTTRYLLGTLDVKGEYVPDFSDIQAYVTYDFNPDWQLGLMGNYNRSVYNFVPSERSTALGLINYALELFSVFEGQEVDDFTTSMGGVSLTYIPDRKRNPIFLKWLASTFSSDENERFDILGYYSLREIESGLGSDNLGEVLSELGNGIQHLNVRNFLDINVANIEHKGGLEWQPNNDEGASHFFQWSLKWQHEQIQDEIKEWERLDSAGYSLPYDPEVVRLYNVLRASNTLSSNRWSAYFQDTYTFRNPQSGEWRISAGVRAGYWDLNREWLFSPRVQLLYKPLQSDKDISYRFAAGWYVQPPFYRELRGLDGSINPALRAQKSLHFVGGLTWDFYIGRTNPKKFKFITEAYYKSMWDLVSYDIENVRIRYSGQNDAEGYAMGLDLRLNGEFVPGAESWINLSLLRTRERLLGVQHLQREVGQESAVEVADVPRPTDRLFNLSMFFQDYLPKNENFKMHLNLTVGSGLPFGLQGNNRIYRNTYRFSPYHRVDIGFSYALWTEARRSSKPDHWLAFTRNAWMSLEVFNLMQVQNEAGNTWIKTVFNQQYAIPNYLTSRRINLRLRIDL